MEADERELLDKSVRHALVSAPDADDALDAIGWPDVLAAEPRDAVSVVFGALGDLERGRVVARRRAARRPGRDHRVRRGGRAAGVRRAGTLPVSCPGVRSRSTVSRSRGVHGATRWRFPPRRRSGDRGRRAHRRDRTHDDRGHRSRGRDVEAPGGRGAAGRHRDARAGCVGRRPARRPARARHRARRHRARHAPSRPRRTRSPASSSAVRSPSSRRCGTAWPRPTSRSRRATPRSLPHGTRPTR